MFILLLMLLFHPPTQAENGQCSSGKVIKANVQSRNSTFSRVSGVTILHTINSTRERLLVDCALKCDARDDCPIFNYDNSTCILGANYALDRSHTLTPDSVMVTVLFLKIPVDVLPDRTCIKPENFDKFLEERVKEVLIRNAVNISHPSSTSPSTTPQAKTTSELPTQPSTLYNMTERTTVVSDADTTPVASSTNAPTPHTTSSASTMTSSSTATLSEQPPSSTTTPTTDAPNGESTTTTLTTARLDTSSPFTIDELTTTVDATNTVETTTIVGATITVETLILPITDNIIDLTVNDTSIAPSTTAEPSTESKPTPTTTTTVSTRSPNTTGTLYPYTMPNTTVATSSTSPTTTPTSTVTSSTGPWTTTIANRTSPGGPTTTSTTKMPSPTGPWKSYTRGPTPTTTKPPPSPINICLGDALFGLNAHLCIEDLLLE